MTVRTDPKAERPIRATGPGPDAESLRRSYLELLKLSLCDLAGDETMSVEFSRDARVYSRLLPEDHMEPRIDGRDWPYGGLTMAGLVRLDDLQGCLESVVADGVEGDVIEAGAWRGGASILMRATLDSLGATDREVWVADSFQGFPGSGDGGAADTAPDEMTLLEFLSIPVEEVRRSFARLGLAEGVRFVPGFFAETMPGLRGRRWSLIRLEGDSYEATRDCLNALYPGVSRGGYVVVDDYGAIEVCRAAVEDFRLEHDISEPLEQVDWTCVRWRRESEPAEAAPPPAAPEPSGELQPAAEQGAEHRIPSIYELQARNELAELQRRLERPGGIRRYARAARRRLLRR
jgi:O-methyltransferase